MPVKHLKLTEETSGGGDGKNLHLDFLWGESTSFKTKPHISIPWLEREGEELKEKGLNLTSFCKKAAIVSLKLKEKNWKTSLLKCVFRGGGEEEQELWLEEEYTLEKAKESK